VRPGGRICLIAAIVLVLGGFSPARADDPATCRTQTAPPDEGIAACTRLIDSGKLHGSDLANRYVDRGMNWRRKNDPDRATSDYNQAIAVGGRLPQPRQRLVRQAPIRRGLGRLRQGDQRVGRRRYQLGDCLQQSRQCLADEGGF
jgi:hypothetical protein